MKKATNELLETIKTFKEGSRPYGLTPFDSNHFFLQMFRLYNDGSYSYPGNEPGYKKLYEGTTQC